MIEYDRASPPDWIEHVDLGDGEWGDLLTRLPYEREMVMEAAFEAQGREGAPATGYVMACVKAHLVDGAFRDYLTKQMAGVAGVNRADPAKVAVLAERAYELHLAFRDVAFPKASTPTDTSTPGQTASPSSGSTDSAAEPSAT
jgi:hypothetical protein